MNGYEADQKAAGAECSTGRGKHRRELEAKVDADCKALAMTEPMQSIDSRAERIATVLGVDGRKTNNAEASAKFLYSVVSSEGST